MLVDNLQAIGGAAREFVKGMAGRRVFAFRGAMGAGKTTFIKALCEELGVKDTVNSPTFAVVNEYYSESLGEAVYHFDFYRVESPEEALRIGLYDYFDSGCLCFIEWAEKIESLLPEDVVFVEIAELPDGKRRIEVI
jgi:tRNA threonylcarbamoyladenosine biosynthesis protein TsaE